MERMDGDGTSSSSSSVSGCKRKRIAGRQKIAIEPIQIEAARQVCFSKRRNGLFNKAKELAVLCGAQIKIIAFSPAGKPFSFIHFSDSSNLDCHVSLPNRPSDQDLKVSELDYSLKKAKTKTAVLKTSLCGADVADLMLDELDMAVMKRQRLIADLALRYDELSFLPNQPIPVPVQEPVPTQVGNGYDLALRYDDLSFLPNQLVPVQEPVPTQVGNGYDLALRYDDDLFFLPNQLVPVQEPVPIQVGNGYDGFCCGTELFSLDDFYFDGGFGLIC